MGTPPREVDEAEMHRLMMADSPPRPDAADAGAERDRRDVARREDRDEGGNAAEVSGKKKSKRNKKDKKDKKAKKASKKEKKKKDKKRPRGDGSDSAGSDFDEEEEELMLSDLDDDSDDFSADDSGEDSMAAASDELEDENEDTSYIDRHKTTNISDIADRLGQKYLGRRAQTAADREPAAEAEDDEVIQADEDEALAAAAGGAMTQGMIASRLPNANDPKVFAVKVRPNTARQLVARIVNKCHAFLHGKTALGVRQDLGIISAFCVDHIKEYIYLEAHRQLFVENALAGLQNVFRYKITQVDPKELPLLLTPQVRHDNDVKKGEFVRLKSGPYGGDIALVERLEEAGQAVILRLVPREDFVEKRYERHSWRKGTPRRPQRFFIPSQAVDAYAIAGGMSQWGELKFDEGGYLMKMARPRNLLAGAQCPRPTVDELVVFFHNDREKVDAALSRPTVGGHAAPKVTSGELVRVVEGSLRNAVGRVVEVINADRRVVLSVQRRGCAPMDVTVDVSEVVKHFTDGSHVCVAAGPAAGESGTVVHTKERSVVIMTDRGNAQVVALCDHCVASSLSTGGQHVVGGHKLYDLVMLNDDTVGCIVLLVGRTVSVLTAAGNVVLVQLSHIGQTLRERAHASDAFLNIVGQRDVIRVADHGTPPSLAGCKARVEHVFGTTIFAVSESVRDNCGMFAINAKLVSLVGGHTKFKAASQFRRGFVPPKAMMNASLAPPLASRDYVSAPRRSAAPSTAHASAAHPDAMSSVMTAYHEEEALGPGDYV